MVRVEWRQNEETTGETAGFFSKCVVCKITRPSSYFLVFSHQR